MQKLVLSGTGTNASLNWLLDIGGGGAGLLLLLLLALWWWTRSKEPTRAPIPKDSAIPRQPSDPAVKWPTVTPAIGPEAIQAEVGGV